MVGYGGHVQLVSSNCPIHVKLKCACSVCLTLKAWSTGRSMMKGLLDWIPAMDSERPRLMKDCLTVREARDSSVTRRIGQVNLTQLNPMDLILFDIKSAGCLLNPSAINGSICATQFTHASFTLSPSSLTIHRESVYSG